MREFKTRKLKSSSGKRVTKEHSSKRKQAVAIALRSSKQCLVPAKTVIIQIVNVQKIVTIKNVIVTAIMRKN